MTASAVTSTAEASASSPLQSVIQLTSENNNSNWKRSFHLDLAPSLPLSSSRDEYSSIGNDPELSRSSASSSLPPTMFSSWSRLSHSSLHFLRGNTLASLSASNAGGPSPGSGTAKTSSATSNGVLTTVQSTSNLQRNAATAVELQGASATTSTTIPLHSANKTTTPAATATAATILTSSKRPVIIIYPTVSPESIVIPIVSCIFGFPLLALLVICCLRRRAKLARERERRRNYDMQDHAVSLVRFSPIHRLNNRSSRAISLRPERSLSRGFPSLELDTVIEERSDPEQTQTDLLSPESPIDPHKFREFHSS